MLGLQVGKQAAGLASVIRLHMILDVKLIGKPASALIQDGGSWGFDLGVFDVTR